MCRYASIKIPFDFVAFMDIELQQFNMEFEQLDGVGAV